MTLPVNNYLFYSKSVKSVNVTTLHTEADET